MKELDLEGIDVETRLATDEEVVEATIDNGQKAEKQEANASNHGDPPDPPPKLVVLS